MNWRKKAYRNQIKTLEATESAPLARGTKRKVAGSFDMWKKLERRANRQGWYVYKWTGNIVNQFTLIYLGSCIVQKKQ